MPRLDEPEPRPSRQQERKSEDKRQADLLAEWTRARHECRSPATEPSRRPGDAVSSAGYQLGQNQKAKSPGNNESHDDGIHRQVACKSLEAVRLQRKACIAEGRDRMKERPVNVSRQVSRTGR